MDTKADANLEKSGGKDKYAQSRSVLSNLLILAFTCIVCFNAYAQAASARADSSKNHAAEKAEVSRTGSTTSGITTLVLEQALMSYHTVAQSVQDKLYLEARPRVYESVCAFYLPCWQSGNYCADGLFETLLFISTPYGLGQLLNSLYSLAPNSGLLLMAVLCFKSVTQICFLHVANSKSRSMALRGARRLHDLVRAKLPLLLSCLFCLGLYAQALAECAQQSNKQLFEEVAVSRVSTVASLLRNRPELKFAQAFQAWETTTLPCSPPSSYIVLKQVGNNETVTVQVVAAKSGAVPAGESQFEGLGVFYWSEDTVRMNALMGAIVLVLDLGALVLISIGTFGLCRLVFSIGKSFQEPEEDFSLWSWADG